MTKSRNQPLGDYPRFRSNYTIKSLPAKGQTIWLSACAGPSSWSDYPPVDMPVATLDGEDKIMYDWVVPRFKARSAAGEVFFNNLSSEKVTVETKTAGFWQQSQIVPSMCGATPRRNEFRHASGGIISFLPNQPHHRYGAWPLESQLVSASELNRMQVLASTAVLSKRGRSDSDLWESLAEYRQTLSLLEKPIAELKSKSYRMLTSIQRSNGSRQLLRDISAAHLLHRYGITPLMKDVASVMKTFERQIGLQRKTSRANEEYFTSQTTTGDSLHGVMKANWSCETREHIQVRAMSLDEVDLSLLGNIGFSTKGLLTLPYELISYSFVADWFANIGDYLGALAPAVGYKQLGSGMTTIITRSTLYTFTGTRGPDAGNWSYTGGLSGTCAIVRQLRTRHGLATPAIQLRSDFKFDQFNRTADAIALVASRFVKINNLLGPTPPVGMTYRQKQKTLLWLNQPGVS